MTNNKSLNQYTEKDVIAANRNVYAENATSYDDIVITHDSYNRLRLLLFKIVDLFLKNKEKILALDACGGSGNASFILNELGFETHLVDLSPEMIKSFNNRCRLSGIQIKTFIYEINDYFKKNDNSYDLIVFSSALHHLRFPEKVLINAIKNLTPGGLIVTLADPTINIQKLSFKIFSLFDEGFNLLVKNPKILFNRVRKKIFNSNKISDIQGGLNGWLAEFHAQNGIDDLSLIKKINSSGNYILWHKRYTGGYTPFFQFLYRKFKLNTSFSLIISNKIYSNINIKIDI